MVWTKFELADDGETDRVIKGFIERFFLTSVARDKVSCISAESNVCDRDTDPTTSLSGSITHQPLNQALR